MEATGRTETCDVAVVGGGILGLALAAVTAQQGYHVILFRLSDQGRPRADTLRNQGWLQSGLMYVGHYGAEHDANRVKGRALAARMRAAGRDMLRDLRLPPIPETEYGIYRLADDEQAAKLEADAKELRIKGVKKLADVDVIRSRLGPVYDDGGVYYQIPDLPFPEAKVLRRLREWAIRDGAILIQVDAPLRMIASGESTSGVELVFQGSRVRSGITIAAAGAGNHALLSELGIDTKMEIQQTPLLVVHNTLSILAPLFADRFRGFSFVRHNAEPDTLPDGALVIGTRAARFVPYVTPDSRVINDQDIETFSRHVPPAFLPLIEQGRFTAGFEVVPHRDLKLPYVAPWLQWYPEFPALLMAMPGRATMGVSVARQILEQIKQRLEPPPSGRRPSTDGPQWGDDIFMHFHRHYDFDDWQRSQGGN
jgi:glycine/D-amino acid oxidase-like deaminating enzyme